MPQLVFLHGFLGSPVDAEAWRERLPSCDVISPMLGIAECWDDEVDRLADELPENAHLAGYSLGARLAIALAIRNPRKWRSLVVISGSPGLATQAERAQRRESDDCWCERLRQETMEEVLDAWYRQSVFHGDPPDVLARLKVERRDSDRNRAERILRVLSVANQPDYRAKLSELTIPVIFLAGDNDEKYASLGREMAAFLPNSELHFIAGAGHALHRSHPAETFRTIYQFITRVDKGSSSTVHSTSIGIRS